jgi:hypothetical protein
MGGALPFNHLQRTADTVGCPNGLAFVVTPSGSENLVLISDSLIMH